MDVDPYQWSSADQIPTWSIFHQDNRPRPLFNGVSHSGEPAASYADSTVPPIHFPSTVAHNNIPHGDYVETDVVMFEDDYVEPPPVMTGYPYAAHWESVEGPALRTNAVPVIIGYAPGYREDMEIDAEGPPIEFQPINHYPPHFGAEAIPGNPIIFNGRGIDDNLNGPYFNARPQVVPPEAFANDGVIPYDPTEPYFNVGPQVGIAGIYNPITNVYPPYNAPQAVADDHFFRANANGPPAFQEPIVPAVAREAEEAVDARRPGNRAELFGELFGDDEEEEDEEEDEPANAPGPVWGGPPWEPDDDDDDSDDSDDDELEIYTGM
jgi:hypothetical protein